MKLPSSLYDLLKWVTMILLPAVSALYFGLAQVWNWDNAAPVVASIALVTAFLGAVLRISTAAYNASDDKYDGTIDPIDANNQTTAQALSLSTTPADVSTKKEVLLKVNPGNSPTDAPATPGPTAG